MLSVIWISSAVSISFAMGIVFNGMSVISGRGGESSAMVASRCFWRSRATSRHVAPEAIVTVAVVMVRSQARLVVQAEEENGRRLKWMH